MSKDQGYKGHRADSLAGKAHKVVDDNPKMKRSELIGKLKKLGVAEDTAAHWISVFHNWASRKKPVAKPKPAPSKKAQPVKKAPLKKMTPAQSKKRAKKDNAAGQGEPAVVKPAPGAIATAPVPAPNAASPAPS